MIHGGILLSFFFLFSLIVQNFCLICQAVLYVVLLQKFKEYIYIASIKPF